MTVRFVLDFVAPAGFSNRQVKIPASSAQVFLMIMVDEVSSLSKEISLLALSWKVYLNHLTTGIGLASNSTLNLAAWPSWAETGSKDLVKIGAMKFGCKKN